MARYKKKKRSHGEVELNMTAMLALRLVLDDRKRLMRFTAAEIAVARKL